MATGALDEGDADNAIVETGEVSCGALRQLTTKPMKHAKK